jgi:CheY-like chemotaxis protein
MPGFFINTARTMTHSILIVDDHREVLRVLEKALGTLGQRFIITGVLSGEEALLEARLSQVDLLITDIRLPGMSGLELFTRIRILRPQVKTFLLTGLKDEKTNHTASSAGADGFFPKPVNLADFLDAVVRVLGLDLDGPIPDPLLEPEEEAPAAETVNLSDRLSQLRQDLSARAVLLVDAEGQVLARAGYLQDADSEPHLIDSVTAVLQSAARVNRLIPGKPGESIHNFPGETDGLVAAPVGSGHGLITAVPNETLASSALPVAEIVRDAAADIARILPHFGISLVPEPPNETPPFVTDIEEPVEVDTTAPDEALENLIEDGLDAAAQAAAESFWEPEEDLSAPVTPEGLSYEQAVDLGLVTDD